MSRFLILLIFAASISGCVSTDFAASAVETPVAATPVALPPVTAATPDHSAAFEKLGHTLQKQSQLLAQLNRKVINLTQEVDEIDQSNQIEQLQNTIQDMAIKNKNVQEIYNPAPIGLVGTPQTESIATNTKLAPTATLNDPAAIPEKFLVLGAIEKVTFEGIDHGFTARVDTGAATSSLNALNIEKFERNGKKWVRFDLAESGKKEIDTIETRIIRTVKIRQQTSGGKAQVRLVVSLSMRLGPISQKADFTLADRTLMTHPVLLGREFIKDLALVNVGTEYNLSKKE